MPAEWYLDFVDPSYRPTREDLIVLFRVEHASGISMREAVGRVALESSIGNPNSSGRSSPKKVSTHMV